jgi:hypothetical protein
MKKNITSPHDRFFKNMMADPRVVKDFFKEYLPVKVNDRQTFQLPTIFIAKLNPNSISTNRVNPLHITALPGGGSGDLAR